MNEKKWVALKDFFMEMSEIAPKRYITSMAGVPNISQKEHFDYFKKELSESGLLADTGVNAETFDSWLNVSFDDAEPSEAQILQIARNAAARKHSRRYLQLANICIHYMR